MRTGSFNEGSLLEQAVGPRTTAQTPLAWPTPGWKRDYLSLEGLTADDLARLRAQHEADRAAGEAVRAALA